MITPAERSPDFSYCEFSVSHELREHLESISLTMRLRKMAGPQAEEVLTEPRRCPAELRVRIAGLEKMLADAERLAEHYERLAYRDEYYQTTVDYFRSRQEEITAQIAVLKLEMEGWL